MSKNVPIKLTVVNWLDDELRETVVDPAYDGEGATPTLIREATVYNPVSGKKADVYVSGTAKEWNGADTRFVDGFLSSDGTRLFIQPRPAYRSLEASRLL